MKQRSLALLTRLRRDTAGLTTVEYVIVLCLIAVVAVGTWNTFGGHIHKYLLDADTKIGDEMS